MCKRVLFLASNVGLWAEELQAPWDALKAAGHEVTLATRTGKTPLPHMVSMDPEFIDPQQNYKVNPQEVVERVKVILETGEWNNPVKIEEAKAEDYDALVIVGGPGAALDLAGNPFVHDLTYSFYKQDKLIGALCYAVGCLVWTRDPEYGNKSIIRGRIVTAHPHAWDFTSEMGYPLYNATLDNPGTDLVTQGFTFPLQPIVEDAVGPEGKVLSDPTANREKPQVAVDYPFVTALSVESSIAFGQTLAEHLVERAGSRPNLHREERENSMQSKGTVDIFRGDRIAIHSYMSPADGEMVRSHIVETDSHLVVIDVQLMREYAQELRRYVDRLRKPVARVIVTHAHPDHWMGWEYFADLPIYALPEVIDELETMGGFWVNLKRQQLGNLVADKAVLPTHPLDEGLFTLDGVQFKVAKVTGAEASTTTTVELPQVKTLLAQDLVYNHVYLFVGERHGPDHTVTCFEGWTRALQALQTQQFDLILPGHGEPTDSSILGELIAYLAAVEEILAESSNPEEFKQGVMQRFPDYRLPLLLDFSVFTLFPQPA